MRPDVAAHRAGYGHAALLAGALILLIGNLFIEGRAPMKDDVAWLIHVAQSWLDGGQPYVTEIEVNPPPIIWFSAFAVWLARRLGASVSFVYPGLVSAVFTLVAWWVASLLARREVFRPAAAVFLITLAVLLFIPAAEFGQREHLIAALALPWIVWRAATGNGSTLDAREGFAAGLLAGVCCALKPLFVIPFLLVELAMWRRDGRIGWPGMAGAVVSGVTLALLSLVAHPAYLAEVVPLAMSHYRVPFQLALLLPPGTLLLGAALGAALVLWWLRRHELRHAGLILALLVFAIGAMVNYFIPGRGWFYHRIPATVATVLALAAMCVLLPVPVLARAGVAAMLLALAGQAGGRYVPRVAIATGLAPADVHQIAAIAREHHATGLMAFSGTLGRGFPVVELSHTRWSSRFASMWAVRSELLDELAHPGVSGPTVARRWVVDDFLAACPDIVVVDRVDGMDYPAALSSFDAAFARAWSGYRPIAAPPGVQMYHRPPEAPPCGTPDHDAPGSPASIAAAARHWAGSGR
ncbi:MAG: hypothetical protein V4653_00830 [Pseudomonadota bacterium]